MAVIVSLLSIVILLLLQLSSSGHCAATTLEYAVQVEPVIFIREPESQILTDKEQLSLSCQARVAVLVSKQPLPTISWRKNGIPLSDGENVSITTNAIIGLSELVIQETNTGSSGYYQCVANDANGKYVTVSRKATVAVFSAELLIPIEAQLGQPLYLNCSSVFGARNNWTHNGVAISNEHVLTTGSLFIPSVDEDHQGFWQCYTAYNITLSLKPFSDEESIPILFVDTNSTDVLYGMTIELYCVIAGLHPGASIESITWYRQTEFNQRLLLTTKEFSGSGYALEDAYIISGLDDNNSGRYFCSVEIISNNTMRTIDSHILDILTTGIPSMTSNSTVSEIFLELDANSLNLKCSFETKVSFNVYWMKNGKVIDTLNTYNEITGTLEVLKENFQDNDLFGIYQCFVENEYGSNHILTRVLVKGHSNPPGNLVIRSSTNVSNSFLPYLEISWTPPTHRGGINELSYSIQIGDAYNVMNLMTALTLPSSTANSTIVQLSSDSVYTVVVSVYRPNVQGLRADCIIDTRERFFSINKPFDYLTCTNDGRVFVQWTPLGSDPSLYPTEFVTIEGTCVYNGKIFQFQHITDELFAQYSEEAFSDRSPGTICQFHGKYRYETIPLISCSDKNLDYIELPYHEIPKTTCQVQDNVPAKEDIMQLALLCDISGIKIRWNASEDVICESISNSSVILNVSGVCVYKDEVVEFNHTIDLMNEPIGQVNFGMVKANSICSFGEEISDITFVISPAQCVIDSSSQISFDDYYSSLGEYQNSIDCSKPQYADSMQASSHSSMAYFETTLLIKPPDSNRQGDVMITVITFSVCFAVFVIFLVFLLVVIAFYFKRKYNRSLKRSWSLSAFGKGENIVACMYEETCSLKTETNSLHNEDVNVGLNIYHGYTIEHTPEPDTTGSSGYGSETTPQCCDYHSKKLNEVSDEEIANNTNPSSNGSMKDRQSKKIISICACCSRIHYRRPGSVDNMCSCISNEEYIILASLYHSDEVIDQCNNNCQLNSKDWQGTRLSTLSV